MDSEYIEQLLEKYWNCQTTLEEEKQLQDYFTSSSVPDSLKETAAMFLYFREQGKRELTDISFDSTVRKKIGKPRGQVATLIFNSMRIAAGIVVVVLAVWLVRLEVRKDAPDVYADTYNDPEKAFEETKRALLMISKSFSTAEEQARKINLFNEAQEEIRAQENKKEL